MFQSQAYSACFDETRFQASQKQYEIESMLNMAALERQWIMSEGCAAERVPPVASWC